MTRLALDDPEITTKDALAEATRTFNERENIRGFSPIQHALGRTPDITGRVFPRQFSDSPDLLTENAGGEFQRNLERMKSAEQAFLDWTYHHRVNRAQNSRSRQLSDYQPGDLVYIWRKQVSGQSAVKGGSFVGPARLLALEHRRSADGASKQTSSAWCVRGRRLLKCSLEQLRHASEKETILHELEDGSASASWDFHCITVGLGKNEFQDVSNERPTDLEWEQAQDPTKQLCQPRYRVRGKRGSSPMLDEDMEPISQIPRARSPRPHVPPAEDPTLWAEAGEKWWGSANVVEQVSPTECAFWTDATAAVEIHIPMPESRAGAERALADLPAYFTSSFKKRASIEISEKHLNAEEREMFRMSKMVEVNNFIAAKAFETLPDKLKPSADQAIRMRWILTWKYEEDGSRKAKARAVLLRYQDPCYEQRATNSPTTTRQTRQLQLQLSASLKFKMRKGDVTGAFLQSRPYPQPWDCPESPREHHSSPKGMLRSGGCTT